MMDTQISPTEAIAPGKGWHIGLWVAQILLFLMFAVAGWMKLATPTPELTVILKPMGIPVSLARFIGAAELSGALGVILPAATRVLPWLTPVAASGLFIIMVLATGVNGLHHDLPSSITTIVLGAIALFVTWGRFKKAPIRAR
jgi:putative oxidoreductase